MLTLHVLGVDDELGMRHGLERALAAYSADIPDIGEEVNFDIKLAETGEQAVEIIKAQAPDILLLDYKLPGINGLEVLNQTAAEAENMLTIMITAYASIETAISATKQGVYDFLPKPFTPADLKHTVRKAATRIILARRARELEEENKRVRFDFIRVLGHELKAPLSSISSYLYLFQDHTLGENLQDYNEISDRCLTRLEQMRKLIADLLDMTRIESGEKSRQIMTVDLCAAVERAVELVKVEADSRNIRVETDVPADCSMAGDATEIDMILNNLASNAVKYNRPEGHVSISLTREENCITLRVADTGIGMTPEEAEKLFEEFVRIRNEKTQDILGSGLGLSILKKLSALYDGDISVESEADKGSTFTVRLYDASLATDND
jgi:two-component system, sensor histidine kinase and response regulator